MAEDAPTSSAPLQPQPVPAPVSVPRLAAGPRPHGPITLAELTAGLIWPRLLMTASLAFRPGRMLMAYLLVLLVAGLSDVFVGLIAPNDPARTPPGVLAGAWAEAWSAVRERALGADVIGVIDAAWSIGIARPAQSLADQPWMSAAYVLLLAPVVLLLGGAIARSAALEFGPKLDVRSSHAIMFAIRRWRAFLGAGLLPPALIGVLALALAGLGWLLFRWESLSAITAALYGPMLLLGFVLMGAGVALALSLWLIVPAVACESSDSMDAVQRAYAYTLGRPGRALVYALIVLAQALIACLVAEWLIELTLGVTRRAALAWLPEAAAASATTRPVFTMWESAARLLLPAYAVSYLFTGSTVLYLLLRRVNDEQDIEEVWVESAPATPDGSTAGRPIRS